VDGKAKTFHEAVKNDATSHLVYITSGRYFCEKENPKIQEASSLGRINEILKYWSLVTANF